MSPRMCNAPRIKPHPLLEGLIWDSFHQSDVLRRSKWFGMYTSFTSSQLDKWGLSHPHFHTLHFWTLYSVISPCGVHRAHDTHGAHRAHRVCGAHRAHGVYRVHRSHRTHRAHLHDFRPISQSLPRGPNVKTQVPSSDVKTQVPPRHEDTGIPLICEDTDAPIRPQDTGALLRCKDTGAPQTWRHRYTPSDMKTQVHPQMWQHRCPPQMWRHRWLPSDLNKFDTLWANQVVYT